MPYLLVKRLLLIIRNRNLWLILKKILVTSRDNGLTPFPAKPLVFNMMNEKLKDKVVAIELAGNNILLVNDNDNFKNELISLGFEKVEPYYSISMPIDDVEKRAALFQKLMEIGTLFSNGRDWSPSEIVRYYRDKGLIEGDYLRIVWRNEQDFDITTE